MTRDELHRLIDEIPEQNLKAAAGALKPFHSEAEAPRNTLQRFLKAILPDSLAESVETESRAWIMRCPEGHEQSVWEAGGVRWKASGEPRLMAPCSECGKTVWHSLSKRAAV